MSSKKRISVVTLGCSKNSVDTEHLLSSLDPSLFEIVEFTEGTSVDVLLVNTCGFIADAKQESIEAVLQACELKKKGRIGELAVFGCLSQRYASYLKEEMPEVDRWFGARDLAPVLEYLGVSGQGSVPSGRFKVQGKGYAYLKISEGCDRRCSYCAIPFIRGAHKSVPIETLVQEARALAGSGVKELILIAQDTTYYGLDLYRKRSLGALIDSLSEVEGIEWIRIHYSYPADFPEDVLDQMAHNPKVCRYLDIPLQHISDNVLSNMHRGVDSAWTRTLIRTLRERVEGVVLRTTMIVGHPGEGQKEFEELLDFVSEARFERLGAFTYSEEEGTYASSHFADSIPQEEKQRRLDALMEIQRSISSGFNNSRIGSVVRVMVDDCVGDTLVCRSEFESPEVDGEILVKLKDEAQSVRIGDFITVKIVSADDYDLTAEIVENK